MWQVKVQQNKNFVALLRKICYHITIESKYGAWAGPMGGFWAAFDGSGAGAGRMRV